MKYISNKYLPVLMKAWASGESFNMKIILRVGEPIRIRTDYNFDRGINESGSHFPGIIVVRGVKQFRRATSSPPAGGD